jgi:hypothetical protein
MVRANCPKQWRLSRAVCFCKGHARPIWIRSTSVPPQCFSATAPNQTDFIGRMSTSEAPILGAEFPEPPCPGCPPSLSLSKKNRYIQATYSCLNTTFSAKSNPNLMEQVAIQFLTIVLFIFIISIPYLVWCFVYGLFKCGICVNGTCRWTH